MWERGIKMWKKIVGCHNPYQSFTDWIFGQWICPKCKERWVGMSIFFDCTQKHLKGHKIIAKFIECPKCRFKEKV